MLLPIIGIIGTWEGYLAGPEDLYRLGNNAKELYNKGSTIVEFQKTKIVFENKTTTGTAYSTGKISSAKPINTNGYSKLNIHIVETYGAPKITVSLYSKPDGEGTKYASDSFELDGEMTISLPFSQKTDMYLWLTGPSPMTRKLWLSFDRVWLS